MLDSYTPSPYRWIYFPYTKAVSTRYGRYCTIRDNEKEPPTSKSERYWAQIYRTSDNTE